MKLLNYKLLVVLWLIVLGACKSFAGTTNNTYSQTNILAIIQTNIAAANLSNSNAVWTTSNTLYTLYIANSNTLWSITNVTYSTNIAVLMPGSNTINFYYTNGILRNVAP